MNADEMDILAAQLRALRLPDETAVILEFGSVADPGCRQSGAIRVTATKGNHTATSQALRLEDALLMVRARLDEEAERERKKREDAKAKGRK